MNPIQFKSCVDAHRHRVYSYVLHMLHDPAVSADVTQDVFIRLWEHREALDEERVMSWLLRVARNACIDQIRKRKVRQQADDLEDVSAVDLLESDVRTPERETSATLFRERLEEALDQLGEPHRSIVVLREIQEYKYEEISEVLNIPLNTVKVYLHRARKALRKDLGEVYRHDYA